MTTDDVLEEFRQAGALLEGHFILSSGLRSSVFLQKALVFRDAARTGRLCTALAEKIRSAGHGLHRHCVTGAGRDHSRL